VDSPGWARRRGEEPYGRTAEQKVSSFAERSGREAWYAEVFLEGERKIRSGIHLVGKPSGGCIWEDARVRAARQKGEGGVGKPGDRLPGASHTLKIDATPRRDGLSGPELGSGEVSASPGSSAEKVSRPPCIQILRKGKRGLES
jgi:hypothetical protein